MTPMCSYPGCRKEPAPKHAHWCGDHCGCVACLLTRFYDGKFKKFANTRYVTVPPTERPRG